MGDPDTKQDTGANAGLPPEVLQKLEELKAAFKSSLGERMEILFTASQSLSADQPIDEQLSHIKALRDGAHKLAGAAGTFGFTALGNSAFTLEEACENLMTENRAITASEIEGLVAFVDDCRKAAEE